MSPNIEVPVPIYTLLQITGANLYRVVPSMMPIVTLWNNVISFPDLAFACITIK